MTWTSLLQSAISNWQLTILVVSGLFYTVGYLYAHLFLYQLKVRVPPTEVYDPVSLFVSGLTTELGSLLPITVLLLFLHPLREGDLRITYPANVLIPLVLLPVVYYAIPKLAKLNPLGFQFLPEEYLLERRIFRIPTTIILVGFVVAGVTPGLTGIVVTIISFFIWQAILLASFAQIAGFVGVGGTPGSFSQYPALLGHLVTKGRVSRAGSKGPKFASGLWITSGILLARRDGAYYFRPGTFAQEYDDSVLDAVLLIVPESHVVAFLQMPPSDEGRG